MGAIFYRRLLSRLAPRLEELEARTLLSADGPAGWTAHPDLQVLPAGTGGGAPYSPYQVRHAYGFDKLALDGAGQTIAIVDAFDEPNILNDLKQFDKAFGLPNPGPTTFTFTKATPQGQPPVDKTWAGEIALDVEWAHAIAPRANILLVEAKSGSNDDLLAAVDYARHYPGVVAVSMSWGGPEFNTESSFDRYFTTPAGHQGVAFVASAGDDGTRNGPEWPSVSPNVLAVGGTSLTLTAQNTYSGETGWGSGGGGYSHYVSEPAYQRAAQGSGRRTDPDVAYDANPNTGFYIYMSVPQSGQSGWFTYGGTSAGAPQWAALIALADQWLARTGKGSLANVPAAVYQLPAGDFHDVTAGSNGYAAHSGYDMLTGRGSPRADLVITDLVYRAASFAVRGSSTVSPHVISASGSASPQAALADDPVGTFDPAAGAALLVDRPAAAPAFQTVVETIFVSPRAGRLFENANARNGATAFLASNGVPRLPRQGANHADAFEDLIELLVDQGRG